MSTVCHVGPTWKGFASISRLVIFGDSYSAVASNMLAPWPRPDAENPLGFRFPGLTYNESDQPNWVGHLITKYCRKPRYRGLVPPNNGKRPNTWFGRLIEKYRSRGGQNTEGRTEEAEKLEAAWAESPFLVHDYAKGGDTVAGVRNQIQQLFLPTVGTKPAWAPWTPVETLFITWVGINDCAGVISEDTMAKLFSYQNELYHSGARNFLFIDVPTVHRIPGVPQHLAERTKAKVSEWNRNLLRAAQQFCSDHEDATVLLFSSFAAFDVLLDNPIIFGLDPWDVRKRGGSIWMDHIHPCSKVHDHVAQTIAQFLGGIPPSS